MFKYFLLKFGFLIGILWRWDGADEAECTSTNKDKDESTKEDNEHLLIEDDTIEELSEL